TYSQSTDLNVKNVLNGITGSLALLAHAEGLTRSGARYADYAIGADLAAAVTQFSNIKKTAGMTVAKYMAQQEMIARRLTPFQERILLALDEQSRSGKRIAAMLSLYAQKVIDSAPPGQASFMIPGEKLTKEELFDSAVNQVVVELETEREVARQKAEAKREPAMVAEEVAKLFERFVVKSKHPQPYGPIQIEFIPVRRGQKEFVKAMAKNKRGEIYRASSSDISDVTDKLFFQNETDYIGVERLKAWLSGTITNDQASDWTLGQIRNYLQKESQVRLFETARLRQQLKFANSSNTLYNGVRRNKENAKWNLSEDTKPTESSEGEPSQRENTRSSPASETEVAPKRTRPEVAGNGIRANEAGDAQGRCEGTALKRIEPSQGNSRSELSRGERTGASSGSSEDGANFGGQVHTGIRNPDKGTQHNAQSPFKLQSGLRESSGENSDRARRAVSSLNEEAGRGQKENGSAGVARLASVENKAQLADTLEILQGLREDPPARLFEYSWLARKLDKCNISVRDVDAALNFKPLRDLVAYA
ncbi:MAG: hypothetical protein Q8O98_00660, partial [bacterium]|nr:hypothetical protein [bacterium]